MNEVKFSPNVPQILALGSPEGELDDRYGKVHYTLADGRPLVVSALVATKVNALELRAGETFGICKRWTGEQSEPVAWTVWLTPESEKARADAESEAMQAKLAESIAQVREIRQSAVVPADQRGTGTDGPVPKARPVKAAAASGRLPFNIAFREVVQFVTQELKASGEQWNDQAKQDLVSTVLISASKAGLLGLWERA